MRRTAAVTSAGAAGRVPADRGATVWRRHAAPGRLADGFFLAVADTAPLFAARWRAAASAGRDNPDGIELKAEAAPQRGARGKTARDGVFGRC
jgi:hypothetical protein